MFGYFVTHGMQINQKTHANEPQAAESTRKKTDYINLCETLSPCPAKIQVIALAVKN